MSTDPALVRLSERLYLTVVHLMRRLRRVDEGLGLPTAHLTTLTTLLSEGAMTLGQLAKAEGVRAPTITRRIQQMEEAGLVVRGTSERDGRVVRVRHSARAIAVLEQGRATRAAVIGSRLAALDASDRATLERALEILDEIAA